MKIFGRKSVLSAILFSLAVSILPAYAQTDANKDPNALVPKAPPKDPLAEVEKIRKINNDLAIQHYANMIQKEPKEGAHYAKRGKAYAGNREYEKAEADYDKAIKLDPKLADAYVGRAVTRLLKKDYDGSWQDVHKAESLGGEFWPSFKDALKQGSKRDK